MSWCPRYCVVVPVDFSDLSFSAIDTALELVDDPSHVHVIHVLPPIAVVETGASWREMDEETRRRNAHASATERLAGPRYSGIDIHIAVGEAGQEIAAYADRNHADVIVLSSHGRTGPGRVLIGSIAERIVRLARCPVLVLRWRSALDGS